MHSSTCTSIKKALRSSDHPIRVYLNRFHIISVSDSDNEPVIDFYIVMLTDGVKNMLF